MTARLNNLVLPLAQKATAMRTTDTADSNQARSGAVSLLIGNILRHSDVDSKTIQSGLGIRFVDILFSWAYYAFQVFETTYAKRIAAPERCGFFSSVLLSMGRVRLSVRLATWLCTWFQHPARPKRLKPSPVGLFKLAKEISMQTASIGTREAKAIQRAIRILENSFFRDSVDPLSHPHAVKQYLRLKLTNIAHEEFYAIWLDTRNLVISFDQIAIGTLTNCQVSPREVVRKAMINNAAAVIFCHNHPTGASNPSEADIRLTSDLKILLNSVEVLVLDHIIVGANDICSFSEMGLMK